MKSESNCEWKYTHIIIISKMCVGGKSVVGSMAKEGNCSISSSVFYVETLYVYFRLLVFSL